MHLLNSRGRAVIVGTLGALLTAATAAAGTASIDLLGGEVVMNSKEISGVFGASSPDWAGSQLALVHDDLHASGITTDGLITMVLLETDHGLAFAALVDDNTADSTGNRLDTQLGLSTTAPDHTVEFINDDDEDIDMFFDPPNGTHTAAGFFEWNADGRGDAFAWAQLQVGDFVSFDFTRDGPDFPTHPGLDENDTFQFVSWNGSSWEIVAIGEFSQNDQFSFTFTIIPLPAPIGLGIVGLGLVVVARKRLAAG